jgi:hypothetical protein
MLRSSLVATATLLVLAGCAGLPSWTADSTPSLMPGELTIYDRDQNLLAQEPIPAHHPFEIVLREGVHGQQAGIFAKFNGTIRFVSWRDLTSRPNGSRFHSDSFAQTGELPLRVSRDACGASPPLQFRLRERAGGAGADYRPLGGWAATGLHLPDDLQDALDERWPEEPCEPLPTPVALIQFEPGAAEVTPLHRLQLVATEQRLRQLAAASVLLLGFTDTVGDAAVNRALADRRARAVAAALEGLGLQARIVVEARSEGRSLKPTADGVAEPLNRSVAIFARQG